MTHEEKISNELRRSYNILNQMRKEIKQVKEAGDEKDDDLS